MAGLIDGVPANIREAAPNGIRRRLAFDAGDEPSTRLEGEWHPLRLGMVMDTARAGEHYYDQTGVAHFTSDRKAPA
jgi:hypothetical protein